MRQRVITAIWALAIFIPTIWFGGWAIEVLAILLGLVGLSEFFLMRKRIVVSPDFFVAGLGIIVIILPAGFYGWLKGWLPNNVSHWFNITEFLMILFMLMLVITVTSKNRINVEDIAISALAMAYLGGGFGSLVIVRNQGSFIKLLFVLLIVWTTDSGAYMFGRKFGKHKLTPISPNKTWEGSIGGTVAAVIVGTVYCLIFPEVQAWAMWRMVLIILMLSVVGQFGDLVESAYKRYFGVKDSGKILPGHGGILDRFDSLLFVLPLVQVFGLL
ncbi:phosphatidate cytidylyltransferase [Schleiferilactobacillus perolens]|uniref:Phosphatidate cytidylyltransferase n=1 Tax=Schleiferilactobacillus perolens DSM 12744 TaxID=1423792 RepID=A0A0R1MXP9_9LACO|nr:phosphatidate cytidylyltransferase [Schleiferilactobacillus perolens]KRL12989.1 CDP-diglyceride synthetase [Schleiferilactobacillus perolens DSM 12744]